VGEEGYWVIWVRQWDGVGSEMDLASKATELTWFEVKRGCNDYGTEEGNCASKSSPPSTSWCESDCMETILSMVRTSSTVHYITTSA